MNSDLDKAFAWILKVEGGYVNDPNDRGGETKYGISKKSYRKLDIKNLTKEQAKEIYYKDYWKKVGGDYLPYPLNLIVFDFAVNSGVKRASEYLQQMVNFIEEDGELIVDGKIGKITANIIVLRQHKLLPDLLSRYQLRRENFYANIAQRSPSQRKFFRGWINRLSKLNKFVGLIPN